MIQEDVASRACRFCRFETVFSYAGWECLHVDICSLLVGIEVRIAVIDAWSLILNSRDICRQRLDPCRFFASTSTTVYVYLFIHFFFSLCASLMVIVRHIAIIVCSKIQLCPQ